MSILNTIGLLLVFCLHAVVAYDGDTCCELAKSEGAFISPVPPFANQTCAQVYSTSLVAAQPLYVNYTFCSSKCRGMQLSKVSIPSEWAAPLVQFILPSVIFSMTIPRRKKIEYDYLFDWPRHVTTKVRWLWVNSFLELMISVCLFLVIMIPVIVDTIVWISVIVVGAGNMLISGLYEAHLDYRLVKYLRNMSDSDTDEANLAVRRELLVTIASGNLLLEKGDPQVAIINSITIPRPAHPPSAHEKSRSRLLNLLGAQSSFGGAVGSPVLFYLGAFVYTILDLRTNPSSQDAAIALGFGIEWMIIVHVAIVSGCLLASNNPSTSAGIVGSGHEALDWRPHELHRANTLPSRDSAVAAAHGKWTWKWVSHKILGWSDAYDTEFQPVSLWSRGSNKMKWIQRSRVYQEDEFFRTLMEITWLGWVFKIFVPALALIILPPATGGVVAYFTPPKGIACRSLSFIIYASCQFMITTFALVRCAVDLGEVNAREGEVGEQGHRERVPGEQEAGEHEPGRQEAREQQVGGQEVAEHEVGKREAVPRKTFIQFLFTGWRFIAISAIFWLVSFIAAIGGTIMQIVGVFKNCICYAGANSWWNINALNPAVNLASDTQDARNSSIYWVWMGSTATVFMAINCYIGWWYQRLIRHRFTEVVKAMYLPEPAPHGVHRPPSVPDRPDRAATPSDNGDVADPLLQNDGAHAWAEEAEHAIVTGRSQLTSTWQGLRRASFIREPSPEGSAMSTQPPTIRVSNDESGEEIGLLPLENSRMPDI
jgi:hypothetical protein